MIQRGPRSVAAVRMRCVSHVPDESVDTARTEPGPNCGQTFSRFSLKRRNSAFHPQGHRQAGRRNHPSAGAEAKARPTHSRPTRTLLISPRTGFIGGPGASFPSFNENATGYAIKDCASNTVSHSQRASNHNTESLADVLEETVSHSQRASNDNYFSRIVSGRRLYPILKEHQITTLTDENDPLLHCIPFSKSIKPSAWMAGPPAQKRT